MNVSTVQLVIATSSVVVIVLLVYVYLLIAIRDMKETILTQFSKVTRIVGTDNLPTKPTTYEPGDIVIVHDTRFNQYSLVHLRNVYCRNKQWLYSGIAIEFIKAPQKYGVRKIPTYRTTISGIYEKDITPINDISMKVFKWNQEDL